MSDPRETGFGEPDDEAGDVGFGSPDDEGGPGGDTGFGSPAFDTGARLSQSTVADDGGEIIALVGDFSAHPGPYVVTVDPGVLARVAYGATLGYGRTCYPNAARTRIEFATPPMLPGTYSVRLQGGDVDETITGLTYVRRIHKSRVHSLRALWPGEIMPVGPSSLQDETFDLPAEPNALCRAEFVKAVGEEISALAGIKRTRLTAELAPAGTTATVESTYTLDDAGTVYVAGLDFPRLAYTGKTATTLTGLVRDDRESQTGAIGAAVEVAEGTHNAIEEALADCLLERADGDALNDLARSVCDVSRAGSWMDDDTLRVLAETIAWLDCGTWWAVWRVVEAWSAPFVYEATSTVNGGGISDPGGAFAAHHVGRYVRVYDGDTSAVHRIVAAPSSTSLTLDSKAGPYWTGAAYSSASRTWRLLPFAIDHDSDTGGSMPGKIRVLAYTTGIHAPPTYVQAPTEADYAAVTPPALTATGVDLESEPGAAGDTYAGFVVADADADGTALYPDVPVYPWNGDIPHLRALLEDVVAAWCRVEIDSLAA